MEGTPQPIKWSKESIQGGPERGRGLDEYEKILGFDRKELEGKTVLDLGAGPAAKFADDLEDAEINAKVISLSPDYVDEKNQDFLKLEGDNFEIERIVGNPVAGLAEHLPFSDKSFDEILALYSVSRYSQNNFPMWMREIFRVLKDDGIARIGPFKLEMDAEELSSVLVNGETMNYMQEKEKLEHLIKELGWNYRYANKTDKGVALVIFKNADM